jgi:uncharacterized protein
MKIVLLYELAPGGLGKALAFYDAYRARLEAFHEQGLLLMAGPLGMPPEGAMGIFTHREAAEDFMKEDPFILNGVVSKTRLLEWNDILG